MKSESNLKFRRILLKLSGEFFCGKEEPISFIKVQEIARELDTVVKLGVDIGVVVGGGNIIRGEKQAEIENLPSDELDELGMQATVLNGIALSAELNRLGIDNNIISSIPINPSTGEIYSRRRVKDLLDNNVVIIFVGGTGNPYFTTDTTSILRGLQMGAEIVLKGTRVDGVYDRDPLGNEDAEMYHEISYSDAIDKKLGIMDITAFTMAWKANLPVIVFNATIPGNIEKVIRGEDIGTIIKGGTNG